MDPSPQIIPALYERQKQRGGYLTSADKAEVAKQLGLPPYRVEALVTFFPHFRESPPATAEVHICRDMTCLLRGSESLTLQLKEWAASRHGDQVAVCGVSCLGRCDRAPAAMINEQLFVARPLTELCEVVDAIVEGRPVTPDSDGDMAERKRGTWQMDVYAGRPTYDAVRQYISHPEPLRLFGISSESVVRQSVNLAAGTRQSYAIRCGHDEMLRMALNSSGGAGSLRYTLVGPDGQTRAAVVESEQTLTEWVSRVAGEWSIELQSDAVETTVRLSVERVVDGIEGGLTTAGLLGMGGAGGRAYLKWRDVYFASGKEKYIICNADESEPGTFKDREVLLVAPHLTIEGMILAGLSVGAKRGWIYIRHEYQEQVAAVRQEIERARALNALGPNIFNSGVAFDLDVFVSPGGYICGEQTALIEAMEDKRAEPRNRPPELKTNGFRDQPTLLSNVETFAWVPAIMLKMTSQGRGESSETSPGLWFAQQGRKEGRWVAGQGSRMTGLRLFSISGDVCRPGVYEVPTGIPLGELIDEYCGGMTDGKPLIAAALSGPSGGILPARIAVGHLDPRFVKNHVPHGVTELALRDIPLDIQVARALGIMIGAGLVVYGAGANLLEQAVACSRFFASESCGKCVPCRLGSQKITQIGEQILAGRLAPGLLPLAEQTTTQLSEVMAETSICGLGQVASNPVRSVLRFFPELVVQAATGKGGAV